MNDIAIIYLTQNLLPEGWTKYQQKVLLESIGDSPLVTVSRKPTVIRGEKEINILQTEPSSPSNVYWQMLKAAKLADTEFIGIAEDDTLYCPDHFNYRPPKDVFSYNCSHWSVFVWDPSIYSWRDRKGNYSLICNRQLLIDSLEERFNKYPQGTPPQLTGELGRWRTDRQLKITHHPAIDFYTPNPIVNFNHELGLDDRAKRHQKSFGSLRAFDIPYWGRADELAKNFK